MNLRVDQLARSQKGDAEDLADRLVIRSGRNRIGLDPAFTWHSLRHFYASALIHSGASVKTVQERLGHESAETTMQVYAHLWPGEDERTRKASTPR